MARQKQARNSPGQPRGGAASSRGATASRRTAADRSGTAGTAGTAGTGQPGQVDRKASPPGQARPSTGRAGPGPARPGPAAPKARPGPAAQESQPSKAPDAQPPAPRWLQLTTLILSVFGLGVSVYLTIAHYTTAAVLACSDKGFVNCAKVTTSAQSVVFGIFPVAVLGLAFYVFMVAVNNPWAWRSKLPTIYWARLGSVVVGMIFVLYLLYAEIVEIGNICLWCTSVHVVTFVLFVLLVFHASSRPRPASATLR
jgi:uncharacterized membrane protein